MTDIHTSIQTEGPFLSALHYHSDVTLLLTIFKALIVFIASDIISVDAGGLLAKLYFMNGKI